MYLKKMGAKEPYVAYIKGAIAEVRVGTVSEDLKALPERYADALSSFINHAHPRYNDEFVTIGVEMMLAIVKRRKDDGYWIKTPEAFAASLELHACEVTADVEPPYKKELLEVYGISLSTLNRYYAMLFGSKK